MEKRRKLIRNFIFFLFLIFLTFYILLKDQDLSVLLDTMINADFKFVLIGIMCMLVYLMCEGINIGRTLKALGEKSNFIKNFKYALIGFFFSSITPAASGGQPMQVYYMHRDKISVANSTLALLINLMCMQIVTISIALISLSFNYGYMTGGLIAFFIIGILLNLSALSLLLIAIFWSKLLDKLVSFSVKVMKFFKVKNIEDKKIKFEKEVEKYKENAIYIKKNKGVLLKNLITAYMQFLVYYSISYWVYRALGLSECNIAEITTMQSVVFATVSGIPSPGAVGVSEGAFISIFKSVFPAKLLNSAMLLNRGINFYLFVMISGMLTVINGLKTKKES